jgi:hypothetical protein
MKVFYFFKGRAILSARRVRTNLESKLGEEPLVLSRVVSLLEELLDRLIEI